MRVVFVVTVPGAGPVTHLLTLVPAVAKRGFDVEVVCSHPEVAAAFHEADVAAQVVALRHKLDLGGAARLLPHLARADVVHTHDRRAGLFARPLARARRAGVVHTFHGLPHEIAPLAGASNKQASLRGVSRARRAWLLHGYLRIEATLAKLGTVIVPSRAVADFLVAHGSDARRVRVIPNGIDLRRLEPGPVGTPLAVGTAGILEQRKGVDTLIAACAAVDAPLRLELFGDGSLRERLERQASQLGVAATFHGAVDDVRSRLEELDVFVLASRDENLPMALLEAMAAALPVVATRVGGVPELVEHDQSGLLVDPDDVGAMSAAIARLANEPQVRERLARAGAQVVSERFSVDGMADGVVDVYEELLRVS